MPEPEPVSNVRAFWAAANDLSDAYAKRLFDADARLASAVASDIDHDLAHATGRFLADCLYAADHYGRAAFIAGYRANCPGCVAETQADAAEHRDTN